MKAKIIIPALLFAVMPFTRSFAEDPGQLFKTNCGACHSIGKGKLVGPDLKGVDTRHTEAWILKWVKSSQGLVQAGDKDAVKLFADNNQIVMPDQPLKNDEIKSILGFIKSGGEQPAASATKVADNAGPDAITVATQKVANENKNNDSLLTTFSFTEYLLMFLMGIMLIIIYVMGMAIKTLSERVKEIKIDTAHA